MLFHVAVCAVYVCPSNVVIFLLPAFCLLSLAQSICLPACLPAAAVVAAANVPGQVCFAVRARGKRHRAEDGLQPESTASPPNSGRSAQAFSLSCSLKRSWPTGPEVRHLPVRSSLRLRSRSFHRPSFCSAPREPTFGTLLGFMLFKLAYFPVFPASARPVVLRSFFFCSLLLSFNSLLLLLRSSRSFSTGRDGVFILPSSSEFYYTFPFRRRFVLPCERYPCCFLHRTRQKGEQMERARGKSVITALGRLFACRFASKFH